MEDFDSKDIFSLICSLILPPLGVYLKVGLTSHFWLNLVLTIIGFHIIGVVHALYVIIKK